MLGFIVCSAPYPWYVQRGETLGVNSTMCLGSFKWRSLFGDWEYIRMKLRNSCEYQTEFTHNQGYF